MSIILKDLVISSFIILPCIYYYYYYYYFIIIYSLVSELRAPIDSRYTIYLCIYLLL